MFKNFFYIHILFLVGILVPLSVSAQSLYLLAPGEVKTGETFEILVRVDTSDILINSASARIDYDENLFSFSGYKSEEAVIKLWVDPPQESGGEVYFSGIIPGGVAREFDPTKKEPGDVTLAKLLFTADVTGAGEFGILESKILKHDGEGTEFSHVREGARVEVKNDPDKGEKSSDTEKPLPLVLTFVEAGFFSRTPSMIIWDAEDVDSGIKEYKIKVGLGRWKVGASPYPVTRGIFSKEVRVEALDFGGNSQEASILVPGLIPSKVLITIAALILLCIFGFKMIK